MQPQQDSVQPHVPHDQVPGQEPHRGVRQQPSGMPCQRYTPFRPVHRREGYLALEDMGLIGDGTTSALVGLDGSISWLCLPRFDSAPLFCGLLDQARGGSFTVAPDHVVEFIDV